MKTRSFPGQKAPASPAPVHGRTSAGPVRRRLGRGLYSPELLESRIAPATFTVTSLLDDGSDGTLRKEILDANAAPGADTIVFKLTDPLLPHTIVLGGTEIPITDALTIKGPGIDLLTVSGNDASRIFNISDGTAALRPTAISGLTLTDGKATGSGGAIVCAEPLALKNVAILSSEASANGGGIFASTGGKISITGSRIVHNTAGGAGGGLYLRGVPGVSIVKTTIADNTAAMGHAGLYAAAGGTGIVLIDTCIVANNTGTLGYGGGMKLRSDDTGKAIVKNSLITGNSADFGGGIGIDTGNLVVMKSTFSHNVANSSEGGGIGVDGARSVVISGSRFVGNSTTDPANGGGGALALKGPTLATVTGSFFYSNTTPYTGGAILTENGAVLTMKGSTLSGNVASVFQGGAIFADDNSVLNLSGNKFLENRAADGGGAIFTAGMANPATVNLSGNLIQGNVSDTDGGAVSVIQASMLTSKGDKFIGNVALAGQGGGLNIASTGLSTITGSLIQGNVAGSSGGGVLASGFLNLTSVKVLENVAGPGARGGGLRIAGGVTMLAKSVISGNVAGDGGGIFYNAGTLGIDAATTSKLTGNAATFSPNIGMV